MRILTTGLVVLALLVGAAVVALSLQPSSSALCAQEPGGGTPPVGGGPEPDEAIVQEILEILLAAQPAGGIAGEALEDEVMDLMLQLTPDHTFELGVSEC